jgi:hypothetical protein
MLFDSVMYLTNFITKLSYDEVQDLFLRGLVHGAKKMVEMKYGDPDFESHTDLPIKYHEGLEDDILKFEIAGKTPTEDAIVCLKEENVAELVKTKDYLTLYTLLETVGRTSKSEYGDEFDRYLSTTDKNTRSYHSWLCPNGKVYTVDLGEFYMGDKIRKYCIEAMYDTLDKMIENKNKYYELPEEEVNKLRDLRLLLRGLAIEYNGQKVPVTQFNIAPPKKQEE